MKNLNEFIMSIFQPKIQKNINVPQHIHIIATNQFPGWMCSVKRQTYSLTETEDSYESSIGEGGSAA